MHLLYILPDFLRTMRENWELLFVRVILARTHIFVNQGLSEVNRGVNHWRRNWPRAVEAAPIKAA
jgi:hypothetical protein